MSEEFEPPPDVAQFIERHRETGEAFEAPLNAGKRRLLSAMAAMEREEKATAFKRPLIPVEAVAVAVVLALIAAATWSYRRAASRDEAAATAPLQTEPVATPKPETPTAPVTPLTNEAASVMAAYRVDDLDRASQLLDACSVRDAACAALSTSLRERNALVKNLERLTHAQLARLATLDSTLSGGAATSLTVRIARRQVEPGATPERLAEEAKALSAEKAYPAAIAKLRQCLAIDPSALICIRLIASTHAKLAARDNSSHDFGEAKRYYEYYLQVAPADDEYVPKIQAILAESGR